MIKIKLSKVEVLGEITRIIDFIKANVCEKKIVLGVSGGLDSDVAARLLCKAIGPEKIKLFIVLQNDMEKKYLYNSITLANDLNIDLHKIDLRHFPKELIGQLDKADKTENFQVAGLLDISRAKCSVRTPILSTYQDRGYLVIGTTNKTESTLGFYLPFGDGVAHIKPLLHLYKSQIHQIAQVVGTRFEVLEQPASAGFWKGETDIEDIAYWLFNKAPTQQELSYTKNDLAKIKIIQDQLTTFKIDLAIELITNSSKDASEIGYITNMSLDVINRFISLIQASKEFKGIPLNQHLS